LTSANDGVDAARVGEEVVVAVDCNGADLGPGEVAAGAALAASEGARTILFGPARELSVALRDADGAMIEIVDAPVSIAKSPDPASAARANPDASIVLAARAVAQGRAQALVCAGGTSAPAASTARRWRCPCRCPAGR
jgi:glycerol-3-phosphate acyltransferase PlsX